MRVINKICLFGLNWFVSFRFVSTRLKAAGNKQDLLVWFELVCFISFRFNKVHGCG